MSDDAEFDAFLKGEGALSRSLQSMPQATPGAALDAAILQRARDLMAQEARPQAANDAGASTPAPRIAGLGWRWRVPAGIAATVLAGVFAHQAFQATQDMESQVGMPAPPQDQVLILQPSAAPAPSPQLDMAVPAPPASKALPAPESRASAPAPLPLPLPRPSQVAVPASEAAAAQPTQRVEVTGSAFKRSNAESSMPVTVLEKPELSAPAPAPAPMADSAPASSANREEKQRQELNANVARSIQTETANASRGANLAAAGPDEWLEEIEAMIGSGKDDQLLEQWGRFRKRYPDYPVPQTTTERIDAIRK